MQHLSDLQQYVTDLASTPRLLHEETRHLASHMAAVHQGALSPDLAAPAKQRLIEGYLWLAISLFKRSGARLCMLSPLDLVQEGNLGQLRAIERFDFASGGNFTAYASTTIHYAILDALPMENTIRLSQVLTWRNRTDERVEALRALQPLSLDVAHGEEGCAFLDLLAASPLVLPGRAAQAEEAHHPRTCRRPATPRPPQEQVQRLEAACAELVAQGIPINVRTLARLAYVDKKVVQPFVRLYWDRQGSELERLTATCAELAAEGIPVTMARLCSRAHVGSRAAAAFLKNYHHVVRPKQHPATKVKPASPVKASPQERLATAFAHPFAQGEKITRARLRQVAGISTGAAGAFLRAQRADDADPGPPYIERGNRQS